MATRTFLAVDLDEETRSRLVAVKRAAGTLRSKIHWVQPQNLHVTLQFLGDADDETLARICKKAREAAAKVEAFAFEVVGVACVPPSGRLRMIWASVQDESDGLTRLYHELEGELADLGLRRETRAFKPHVTLARVRFAADSDALRDALQPLREESFGLVHADSVVVYASRLTAEGSLYTPLARAPLGG